jgi:formylglycine-generating enzyme required for sulfatase activity
MKPSKKFIILTIAIIAIVSLSATSIPDVKKDFVKFDEKLFAYRCEVTNIEYREFLQDLKATNKSDEYVKCMYDSTQWDKKFPNASMKPMADYSHWHPAYDHYPIVNITLDAAKSYCEWLTNKYNNSPKKRYKKVTFRLPTEAEWKKLAAPFPGNDLPWSGNLPYEGGQKKTVLANVKFVDSIPGTKLNDALTTIMVGHYKPNSLGLYDVIGNVAEMTQDGKIKGGSWYDLLKDCTTDKTQSYTLPDPRVGFRIIMEITEE